ncbi:S8 family serine peptidase [Nocardioides sp. URHA0020]|uniref:S8 family serine peptidase n=1 Tax=Nocardioides sp. URHA0020 TaxID=1380392 RepID=UPI000686D19F|nr:S8 family serine peptidase [Nocardioides sp. URHA0020]
MSRSSRSRRVVAVLAAGAVSLGTASLAVTTPSASAAPEPAHRALNAGAQKLPGGVSGSRVGHRPAGIPATGRYSFLLELGTTSTGGAFDKARDTGKSMASAKAAGRSQLTRVRTAQSTVIDRLPARTSVIYRTHSILAGVAVRTNVDNYDAISQIPGVAAVYPITPKSYQNSYAVPLQGAPQAWEGTGDAGQGTTIGIIDTGIDFTHANFGGPGTTAAYDAEHAHADDATLSASSIFPTAKVVGGYDLVGDDYNADPADPAYNPVPTPDPNPLDCEGHGSHVAGSAAGLGENADGTTYAGDYDTDTPFADMKIGPGMAPKASLLAFRVFGCAGSTDVVTQAIDKAADPNGDGDTSDHVDVVNMSLGSDFGSPDDADAVAANAASDLGITMAISSGNSYDLYDVGGSPGSARKAITVAASLDAQSVVDGLNVSYEDTDHQFAAERSVAYDWDSKPDLAGQIVIPTGSTTGCTDAPFSPADKAAIAGKIALVTWTDDALECGSAQRAANIAAAGGIGFVYASNKESFSAGITGSAVIPGVLVNKTGGDAIRAAVEASHPVTVTGTGKNAVNQQFPDDDNKLTDFSSRGLRGNGGLKPDVSAVGGTVFSTSVGTGDEGETESGTSMAAPMVAGLSALVVSKHPSWTPEQVKADIMNTAGQNLYVGGSAAPTSDRYAPNRVGSGRIQAVPALDNDVLAYVTDDPGAVSVSFGPVEVTEPMTLTKTVKVDNTGGTSLTYDTSYDEITSVPGVSYDISPAQVTVPADSSTEVTVTFTVDDPTELTKTVDATHGRFEQGVVDPYPLETLADASGNLLLTPTTDAPELRVPVYSAPRPAAQLTQPDRIDLAAGDPQTGTLTSTGVGVDQGSGASSIFSVAAGLELQAVSPVALDCSVVVTDLCVRVPADKGADLKYVGVTSDAPYTTPASAMAYIGLSTRGVFSTPASKVQFEVYLDVNRDGKSDLVMYNTRLPDEDVFVVNLQDLTTGDLVDTELLNGRFGNLDLATFDSDVLMLPLSLAALKPYGIDAQHPRVDYGVLTFASSSLGTIDAIGADPATGNLVDPLSADLFAPAVTVTEEGAGPLVEDQPGLGLTVTGDTESYVRDGGRGLLVLHFHNKAGNKAQVSKLNLQPAVDLVATPSSVVRGASVKLRATAFDPSDAAAPTDKVVVTDTATNKVVGSGVPGSNGTVTITFVPKKPGTFKFKATYAGATSDVVTVKATKAAARVGLSLSARSGKVGKPVTAKVTVATVAGIRATGSVLLKSGGTTVARGTLSGGRATLRFTPRKAGKLRLQAVYAGDSTYNAGKSSTVTYTVKKKKK